jgi:hypothetical protein
VGPKREHRSRKAAAGWATSAGPAKKKQPGWFTRLPLDWNWSSRVLDIAWRIRLVLADLACKGAAGPTGRDSAVVRTYPCTVAF